MLTAQIVRNGRSRPLYFIGLLPSDIEQMQRDDRVLFSTCSDSIGLPVADVVLTVRGSDEEIRDRLSRFVAGLNEPSDGMTDGEWANAMRIGDIAG